MNETKVEILQAKTAAEVWQWIRTHSEEADEEVAAYFNNLAQKEYAENHQNPDLLWTPSTLK